MFRGKRLQGGNWVEGYFFKSDINKRERESGKATLIFTPDCDTFIMVPECHNSFMVVSDTVGQYTGLKDKNGQKIFEGDIAKNEYEDRKYQYFKIFYNDKTLQWEVMNKYGMSGILHNVIGNMEIIGNIHDNPELLENP